MASNPVTRMTAAGLVCFALVVAATGGRSPFAVLIGMIGPLTAAIASWILLERVHARSPEQVSGAMIKLFGAKLILFGAYATLAVLLLPDARIVVRRELRDALHPAPHDRSPVICAASSPSATPPDRACASAETYAQHVAQEHAPAGARDVRRRQGHHRARLQYSLDHPLIHLPTSFGIDMSVTKHVLMLWIVAAVVLLVSR